MNPVARAARKEPNDKVQAAVDRVRAVARQSGSYAYAFVGYPGTDDVLKVYVADARAEVELTHCDRRGLPVDQAKPDPSGSTRPAVVERKRRWFGR